MPTLLKFSIELQSRLEKQAFQDLLRELGVVSGDVEVITHVTSPDQVLQSRLEKQAFQETTKKMLLLLKPKTCRRLLLTVAIPLRKAGISRR